jgi:Ca2+-binding RTX toxin-like protein
VAAVLDGNDTLSGGANVDTYDLSATIAAATITASSATSAEIGTDTLSAIENIIGSQGDDTITLGAGVNVIDGQGGADIIAGGTSNDTLLGGTGNDTFNYTFGDGADTVDGGADFDTLNIIGTDANNTLDVIFDGATLTNFEGGTIANVESVTADLLAGTDRLSYAGTTSDVTVNLSAGTASGFSSIAGIENVTGGSGNDTLTGDALANNLSGGAGNDTYIGDNGDTITESAGGGIDSVFTTSNTFTLANNVENLAFGGVGDFTGTGNGGANIITGGGGNDTLSGGGGADTLVGNGGNDTMNGGTGNDNFLFAPGGGNDTISGFDANPTGGQDLLDISAFGITAADFGARVTIVDLGADTQVTIDGTDTIALLGVNGSGANVITQQDFLLAP